SGSHCCHNRQDCRGAVPVSAEKLLCAIERSIGASNHWFSAQISRQVLGDLFGRFVVALRLRAPPFRISGSRDRENSRELGPDGLSREHFSRGRAEVLGTKICA